MDLCIRLGVIFGKALKKLKNYMIGESKFEKEPYEPFRYKLPICQGEN